MQRLLKRALACLPLLLAGCVHEGPDRAVPWVAYFGQADIPALHEGYDVLVFDLDAHPPLAPHQARGSKVYAYISLAEIAPYRDYAARFAAEPTFFIRPNPTWGSEIVDIRNTRWQEFVLGELLGRVRAQGFDGVFLDTLDSALALDTPDAAQFRGMTYAAIALVHKIRHALGAEFGIMVNRAFDVLPFIAEDINIVVAESIALNSHHTIDIQAYTAIANQLKNIKTKNSHLQIFTLDYPELNDTTTLQELWCLHRRHGFSPLFATPQLQTVPFHEKLRQPLVCP